MKAPEAKRHQTIAGDAAIGRERDFGGRDGRSSALKAVQQSGSRIQLRPVSALSRRLTSAISF